MALVLLVLLVVSIIPTLIVAQLSSQLPLLRSSVNSEAALASAEAGVQNYINLLDSYTNYWCYTSNLASSCNGHGLGQTTQPPENAALPGSCTESDANYDCGKAEGACGPGWEQVPGGGDPVECFAYTPLITQLESTDNPTPSQPLPGTVVLVVVGRAGSGTATDYRRISVGLDVNGPLSFVYYSNYEQPGTADIWNWENTFSGATTADGATCVSVSCYGGTEQPSNLDEVDTTVTYPNPNGPGQITEPLVQALCDYHTDDVNTYLDWYSQNVSPILTQSPYYGPPYPDASYGYDDATGYGAGTAFGPDHPLYGPFYGNFPDPANPGYMFEPACQGNYYIWGTVFRGSVYSNDQLTTCGTGGSGGLPANDVWFQGKDETAVPANFAFPPGWPGTDTGGSGAPYPDMRQPGPLRVLERARDRRRHGLRRRRAAAAVQQLARRLRAARRPELAGVPVHRADDDPLLLGRGEVERVDVRLESSHPQDVPRLRVHGSAGARVRVLDRRLCHRHQLLQRDQCRRQHGQHDDGRRQPHIDGQPHLRPERAVGRERPELLERHRLSDGAGGAAGERGPGRRHLQRQPLLQRRPRLDVELSRPLAAARLAASASTCDEETRSCRGRLGRR